MSAYEIHHTGSGRQFRSDFLERFSKGHWSLPLIVYAPVVLAALGYAFAMLDVAPAMLAAGVVGGLLFWTFAEYWLHRTLFHWERFPKLHFFLHGIHHQYPNDSTRIVMPPGASLALAVPFFFVFTLLLGSNGYGVFAGFVVGYLWYDLTHAWTHLATPRSRWAKQLKRHHMLHHFQSPNARFGVSTPFWDYVFGTAPASIRTDNASSTPEA